MRSSFFIPGWGGPSEPPRFGGLTVLVSKDYKELLPVVRSLIYLDEENGNGRNVKISDYTVRLDRGYPNRASYASTSFETQFLFFIIFVDAWTLSIWCISDGPLSLKSFTGNFFASGSQSAVRFFVAFSSPVIDWTISKGTLLISRDLLVQ